MFDRLTEILTAVATGLGQVAVVVIVIAVIVFAFYGLMKKVPGLAVVLVIGLGIYGVEKASDPMSILTDLRAITTITPDDG